MGKFSIKDNMLNNISQVAEKNNKVQIKEEFKLEFIDITKIKRNPKNFYQIVDIEELAEDIELNGLKQNLIVTPIGNDEYVLIGGERRWTALNKLVSEGKSKFKIAPCKIEDNDSLNNELVLIQTNAQGRERTEKEKLKEVEILTRIYKEKKERGDKIPGRIRERISDDTGLSPTQVGRYQTINNNLIPELKQLIDEEKLTITNASEFSLLNEESQRAILEIINNKVNLTKGEAQELKSKMKKLEDEKKASIDELNNKIQSYELKLEDKNKEVEQYKNISETNINESKEIKNNLSATIEKEKEIISSRIENEKNKEILEIENKYKNEIEKLKSSVENEKEKAEKLKEKLQQSKDNKSEYEIIKFNTDVVTKLVNVTNTFIPVKNKLKEITKNKMNLSEELISEFSKTINECEGFIKELKKYLE